MQRKIIDLSKQNTSAIRDEGLHPVLRRVFAHRGLSSPLDYDYSIEGMIKPDHLPGISDACAHLVQDLREAKKIVIVGDYDCDGATATAVAVKGLKLLGYQQVDYVIPNRFSQGYGLSVETVQRCWDEHKPDTIITVDNGITSVEGVARAKELGMRVIVTDHHLPGSTLPDADALVNPQLSTDDSLKNLAGVGVMFYVLVKLRRVLEAEGFFAEQPLPNLACLMDLVAMGTVADLVRLDKNNRVLVYHGLRRIRQGRCCHAISALCKDGRQGLKNLSAVDISFRIAPKLNAAGRMADMRIGVQALLAEKAEQAWQKVEELCGLNSDRVQVQYDMVDSALAMIANTGKDRTRGVCLYDGGWHQGVIGILASKIKERTYEPTVIFSDDEPGVTVKGSARSIEGINIRQVFANIKEKRPDILVKFGGHAMAAGLTLYKEHLQVFIDLFQEEVAKHSDEIFTETLRVDGPLHSHEITLKTAEAISEQGIWGQGFAEPIFVNEGVVTMMKVLKGLHMKLRLDMGLGGRDIEAIWFFAPERAVKSCREGQRVQLYYRMQSESYMGVKRLALHIVDMKAEIVELAV